MFSLFALLILNSARFKADKLPLPNFQNLVTQAQPIASETCQNSPLRNFDLFNIEGKQVNKLIYFQTKQLLKDAKANNLPLSLTSTFRLCAEQVQLHRQNCLSDSTPAETCSPATEKPGDSLHNYGMAVDFKCDGHPIFESSPCYPWIQENAPKVKLKQRPSEPWHWSFTGQ